MMIDNGYQLTKAFYAEVEQNEAMQLGVTAFHHSLYVWVCELRNRLRRDIVDLPVKYTMQMAFIGSDKTLKKCIDDLENWEIIEVLQRGSNQHVSTKVKLAVAFLRKHCESDMRGGNTAVADLRQQYDGDAKAVRTTKTNKTIKTDKTIAPSEFDLFWNHYGKKTGSKSNAINEWNKLSVSEQQAANKGIDRYKAYQPDAQYRKDPERYLKHRVWESEFNLPSKTGAPSHLSPLFAIAQPVSSNHKPFKELP